MPWCPKCKTEYQTGVKMCADCKVELVDSLSEAKSLIPFFQSDEKKVAEKLVKFFQYSDLDSSLGYDEENDIYIIFIAPEMEKEAKKLYQAFYFVERERMEKGESDVFTYDDDSEDEPKSDNASKVKAAEDTSDTSETDGEQPEEDQQEADAENIGDEDNAFDEDEDQEEDDEEEEDEDEDEDEDNSTYVMKEDQYKDLTGTVWIFLIFGIGGLVFVVLNILGLFHLFNGWVPNTVMGILFLIFIYIALSTNQKAKKVLSEIAVENKLTKDINEWLTKNITPEFLASISDENVSRELNYLRQTDKITEMLLKEFGNQNQSYLDRLIEEYYNKTFDSAEE